MARKERAGPLGFWDFVRERESVRLKRAAGEPPPWTQDRVLARWHFTNVRREDDPGTKFILQYMRRKNLQPLGEHVFNVTAYRLCLSEYGFEKLGWQDIIHWTQERWQKQVRAIGKGVWLGEYYISNLGMRTTKEVPMSIILANTKRWIQNGYMRRGVSEGRKSFLDSMTAHVKGVGPFVANQVLADITLARVCSLPEEGPVALGPGARKGANAYLGGSPIGEAPRQKAHQALEQAWVEQNKEWPYERPLTRMDLQNCFCEFSKYRSGSARKRFDAADRVPPTELI